MLTLNSAQWRGWKHGRQDHFVQRLEGHLRQAWPDEWQAMGEQRLAGFVQRKVADAMALGVQTELDVARFVTLAFALRRGHFDREPWAQDVLMLPDVPARIRVNRLWALARERLAAGQQEDAHGR